ncbi:MAG: hypothetical protein ACI9XB_001100 [Gammaproteobacteria bacterium]|jgi:hypothetical protein
MSWNLRTLGLYALVADDTNRIAQIIYNSQTDIACIQEVQCGTTCPFTLGAKISQAIINILVGIKDRLNTLEGKEEWSFEVSGVNSDEHGHMRDAYAFFWKNYPILTKNPHADAVFQIQSINAPEILTDVDSFPGRRPGLFTVNVSDISNGSITPVNIISYHSLIPCNIYGTYKSPASGKGTDKLSNFAQVGGGSLISRGSGPNRWSYNANGGAPLPQMDTIVLGDFNYDMSKGLTSKPSVNQIYQNFSTNYRPCINELGAVQRTTTYSSDPTRPLAGASAYDNIFVLKNHPNFKAALTFSKNSDVIDFIKAEARTLGQLASITYYPTETAWYVIYKTVYKSQYSKSGISDHLPVWAEFDIAPGSGTTTSARIKPTSFLNYDELFHAVFGVFTTLFKWYYDANAATHRNAVATYLKKFDSTHPFSPPIRKAVITTMLTLYGDDIAISLILKLLLAYDDDPFKSSDYFPQLYLNYIDNIEAGRKMLVSEVVILAHQAQATISLWEIANGRYQKETFNGGTSITVNIFHAANKFYRYDAS